MLGFDDEQAAIGGYNDSFTDGWDGFGACQRMSIDDFKNWLDAGNACRQAQIYQTAQEG